MRAGLRNNEFCLRGLRSIYYLIAIERFHRGRGLFLLLAVATRFYMLKVNIKLFAVDSEKL